MTALLFESGRALAVAFDAARRTSGGWSLLGASSRPSTETPVTGDNILPFVLGIVGVFLATVAVMYWMDLRAHEGVSVLRRRRVALGGVAAQARVVSCSPITTGPMWGGGKLAHSLVYEVEPTGEPPFRARGIEMLSTADRAENLESGKPVRVRFDPADRTIVLVRADRAQVERDEEAARRAREAALLGGHKK
jgi:hypothetical protein